MLRVVLDSVNFINIFRFDIILIGSSVKKLKLCIKVVNSILKACKRNGHVLRKSREKPNQLNRVLDVPSLSLVCHYSLQEIKHSIETKARKQSSSSSLSIEPVARLQRVESVKNDGIRSKNI